MRLLVKLLAITSLAAALFGSGPALAAEGDVVRVSVGAGAAQGNGYSEPSSLSADGSVVAFTSFASNLVSGDTNAAADVFVRATAAASTSRVSVVSGGGQANGRSQAPSISGDGRYVAFESTATNLVSGDTNGVSDVFVHDRTTGTTTRVSVGAGGAQGTKASDSPAISSDGRFVTFRSAATELVAGDTNGYTDIFVRDLQTGATIRASVGTGGAQGLFDSWAPAISATGRYVAFASLSVNLTADDTNRKTDVFVRDVVAGTTSRASVSSLGTQGDGVSVEPAISGDGRFVAFQTDATNLAGVDLNGATDVLLRDRQDGTTTRLSDAAGGAQGNGRSTNPAMSLDGRFVGFDSVATNLVAADTNAAADVFTYDRHLRTLARGSRRNGGAQAAGGGAGPALDTRGRFLAFRSSSSDIVAGDSNGAWDAFRRDQGEPPVADMTITKSDAADPVGVGADIRYTLTARNAGTATSTGVRVTDPLPSGTTYVSSSASQGSCTFDGTTVACAIGTVTSGQAPTATVVLRRSTVGTVTNTARVSMNEVDSTPSNNTATETTAVTGAGEPDLALDIADHQDPVAYGTTITYTLTASNPGTADAPGVSLTNPLPSNATFVSASSSQGAGCTADAVRVTCDLGLIQPSADATVTLVLRPTGEGTVTDTASVATTAAEAQTANNSASETTQVGAARPSLTLSYGYLKPSGLIGENVQYRLNVKENGPATSTGVTLTDPLPSGSSFVSVTTNRGTCAYDGPSRRVTCRHGSMPPGTVATTVLTITGDVEQDMTNTASVAADLADIDPSDNTRSQTSRVTRLSEYPDKTWQTNGAVDAIVSSGGVVYLAGQFSSVRPGGAAAGTGEVPRSNAAAFSASTGELLPWNPGVNGPVNALAVAPGGATIYLGGEFTSVGGQFRNHIAAVTTAGTPTAWDPNVYSYVKALALSPDGTRIYVGGMFKTVNAQPRLRIAALNTADRNLVASFAPTIEYPTKPEAPYVTALKVSPDGGHLYVGGVFDAVSGQAHKSVAKLTLPSGTPVPGWDAAIEKKENREESQVYDIVTRGSEVFVCGDFYKVRGRVSPNVAVVSVADGAHRTFPATDGAVNACAVSGDRLYLGGHFQAIRPNGDDTTNLPGRNHVASVDIGSGTLTIWDPSANSIAGIYAIDVTASKLTVGGYFDKIGRWTPQQGFARFNGQP